MDAALQLFEVGGVSRTCHDRIMRHNAAGRAGWMPGLLERTVPHISIEDDSFFEQRDAAGKPAAGS
jgi:hypothetical protein